MQSEIEILIDDDKGLRLDLLWLRDHCRCNKCYDFSTFQRKINILDIPDDICTKSYDIKDETLEIVCE